MKDKEVVSIVERIKQIQAAEEAEYSKEPVDWDDYVEKQLDDHADILCMLGADLDRLLDYNRKVEARMFDLERECEELRSIINKLLRSLRKVAR